MDFLSKLWNSIVEGFKSVPFFVFILLAVAIIAPSLLGYMLYALLAIVVLAVLAFALFAWKVHRVHRQMQEEFRRQGENAGHQRYNYNPFRRKSDNEGNVSIHATPAMPEKKVSDDVGEYVDFKEEKNDK